MRTYAVQLLRDHGSLVRGQIIRLREDVATDLVNQGIAVWCVV